MSKIILSEQASQPSTPSAGKVAIYADNTATPVLKILDDSGVARTISQTVAGANTQIQFNDALAMGADADFTWDKTNNLLTLGGTDTGVILKGITNEPSSPSAGNLRIYSKLVSGRMLPKWKAPSGVDTSFQSNLGFNTVNVWAPANSTTATGTGWGTSWPACTGTITHPATSAGMGNQMRIMQCTNVATTTNQILGLTGTGATLPQFWVGNSAGQGGFFFQCRWRIMLIPAASIRLFIGLADLSTGLVASDTYSGNLCGFDHITTDNITTMSFVTRNNTTTTRATFTVPTLAAGNSYDATIYCPPAGSTIFYRLVNLLDGSTIVDSSTSTTLPINTAMMGPQVQMSNGTANVTVTTVAIGINKLYIESDM